MQEKNNNGDVATKKRTTRKKIATVDYRNQGQTNPQDDSEFDVKRVKTRQKGAMRKGKEKRREKRK